MTQRPVASVEVGLRVLVACEFSGTVRDAFIAAGHDAMSCDLLPSERPGPHYQEQEQADALQFVKALMDAPIPRIAIENPVSIISSRIRKPDQIIQPWQFGHREAKATCLWLKGLPNLVATNVVGPPPKEGEPNYGEWAKVHYASPGPDRWKERSRFCTGFAAAMATQWGGRTVQERAA